MEIIKEDKYYKLKVDKEYYIFEPIPNILKIITLKVTKKLPRKIKEQILHKLIVDTIKDK